MHYFIYAAPIVSTEKQSCLTYSLPMPIHNRKSLKELRANLRKEGTSAEATLWRFLQRSQLKGRKFRRQHSTGNYILDFYCPSERLAIELDGKEHYTSAGFERDQEREAYLNKLNIRVIRFENEEIFWNIEVVLEKITSYFNSTP